MDAAGPTSDDVSIAPRRIESTPLYSAWRDLWTFRFAKAAVPIAIWLVLGSSVGMALGLFVVFWTRSPIGTVVGVAVTVAVPTFAQWSRAIAARRQFREYARQRSSVVGDVEATRQAWRDYLETVRPRLWPAEGPRVPPSGLWPVDGVIGVVFMGPLMLKWLANVQILPPSVPMWFWIALLCLAASLRGAYGLFLRRRRLRSLEDACSGDACCWCGYGTTRLSDSVTYPSHCPECGVADPCSPPDLLRSAPASRPRIWR